MSTLDRPFGLRPVGTVNGSSWQAKVRLYQADASRTTTNEAGSIFVGDPVKLEADGNVTAAAAGDAILGVAVGVLTIPDGRNGFGFDSNAHGNLNLTRTYLPANTAGWVYVVEDFMGDVLYDVQEDGDSATIAVTDVGANVDLVAPTAHGSTTTGRSLFELDSSTVATTSAQMRIVGRIYAPDNDTGAAGCRWLVRLNERQSDSTTGV